MDLLPVRLSLPPTLAEQPLVMSALDAANATLTLHRRSHGLLSELFRKLLHQLMTAQVRAHDLDLSAVEEAGGSGGLNRDNVY